jgi:predicted DNA-binding protein (MmcQ/YjbR family)
MRLRALALSFPEAREMATWGHPNFCAGNRTFAAYERVGGRPSIAFRGNRADIRRLMGRGPFFLTPYGRGQWVSVWVDGPLNWSVIADLLDRAYRLVALKRMIQALEARSD